MFILYKLVLASRLKTFSILLYEKINMKKNIFRYILLLCILYPGFLFANAGSPMLWFSFLHLIWINFMIGTVESRIIQNIFRIPNRLWIIISGNYASMFAGYYWIAPYFSHLRGYEDFWGMKSRVGTYELNGFFIGFAASFIASLLIEFPFYWLSLYKKKMRWKLLSPFLTVNLITNTLMFLIYFIIAALGAKWG